MSSRVTVISGQPLLAIDGVPQYVLGANYGWRNYGEFGESIYGSANRVVNHLSQIESDFDDLAGQGISTVRWFLFTDGRNGMAFDPSTPFPTGLAQGLFDDIDAALDIARRHNLRILFSALDFLFQKADGHPQILRSAEGRQALLDNVLQPVLDRYAGEDTIFAWEVMNEPDFVISGMDAGSDVRQPLTFSQFSQWVQTFSAAVHRSTNALVTLGGARAKSIARWDQDSLGLDFLQVHLYYREGTNWDTDLYGVPAESLALKRPLLIGEVPGRNDGHVPPVPLADWLAFGLANGYAGVWPWAFSPGDDYSPYDYDAMRQFALDHPQLSNPAAQSGPKP